MIMVGVKGITRGGYFKRNLRRTAAKDIFTSIYGEQVQGYLVCIVYTSNFAFAMSGGVLMSSIGVISLNKIPCLTFGHHYSILMYNFVKFARLQTQE